MPKDRIPAVSFNDKLFQSGCVIIGDAPDHVFPNGRIERQLLVRCFCGKEFIALLMHLRSGHTKSCGCLGPQVTAARNFKHGHAKRGLVTRTHREWTSVIWRCTNPNCEMWPHYGGRGITVCDRWRNSFETFLADMGECPPKLQIDRFPNRDGNYEPGNCRWATTREQRENRDDTRVYTVRGITACLKALCRHFQISYGCVLARLDRGWELERAFFTPNRNKS